MARPTLLRWLLRWLVRRSSKWENPKIREMFRSFSSPSSIRCVFLRISVILGVRGWTLGDPKAREVRTKIYYLQKSASIRPRTSLPKFLQNTGSYMAVAGLNGSVRGHQPPKRSSFCFGPVLGCIGEEVLAVEWTVHSLRFFSCIPKSEMISLFRLKRYGYADKVII